MPVKRIIPVKHVNEWHRVHISGLRHYYVNRHTGVLTVRFYGEHTIRPRPDVLATISQAEVAEATIKGSNWLDSQGLPGTIRYDPPKEEPDA
jgi:hypothetical protein